jgi:flagellar biogenesis protein FliO
MSGKRNLADSRKKRNVKRRSTKKDLSALSGTSATARLSRKLDNPIQHAAPAQSMSELVAEAPIENMLPAICEILPAQATPWETDTFAEPARPAENEIHSDCSVPAERVSSTEGCAPCEPEFQAESMVLAPGGKRDREEPPLTAERKGFRTAFANVWTFLAAMMTQAWSWAQQKLRSQQGKKRLRVCESVSLGEKRFVAVIQVDGEQFLVGGSSSSVATLAHLERSREFSDVFQTRYEQDLSRA